MFMKRKREKKVKRLMLKDLEKEKKYMKMFKRLKM